MASQPQPTISAEDPFGRRLRYERERRGWTQADVAQRLSERGIVLHATAIAKIEQRDARRPRVIRLDEAAAIADIFGLPLGEMLKPAPSLFSEAAVRAEEWAHSVELADSAGKRFFDALRLIERDSWPTEPSTEGSAWEIMFRALARIGPALEGVQRRYERLQADRVRHRIRRTGPAYPSVRPPYTGPRGPGLSDEQYEKILWHEGEQDVEESAVLSPPKRGLPPVHPDDTRAAARRSRDLSRAQYDAATSQETHAYPYNPAGDDKYGASSRPNYPEPASEDGT